MVINSNKAKGYNITLDVSGTIREATSDLGFSYRDYWNTLVVQEDAIGASFMVDQALGIGDPTMRYLHIDTSNAQSILRNLNMFMGNLVDSYLHIGRSLLND